MRLSRMHSVSYRECLKTNMNNRKVQERYLGDQGGATRFGYPKTTTRQAANELTIEDF